jgi:hypothetical protein
MLPCCFLLKDLKILYKKSEPAKFVRSILNVEEFKFRQSVLFPAGTPEFFGIKADFPARKTTSKFCGPKGMKFTAHFLERFICLFIGAISIRLPQNRGPMDFLSFKKISV